MIYFLRGVNSYTAIKKINEFKEAFKKKNESFLIEELDGETDEISEAQFFSMLGQESLFAEKRLVIFKNIFSKNEAFAELFTKNAGTLKKSRDIFVFWENAPKNEISAVFEKYSEKVQEVGLLKFPALDKWLEKRSKEMGLGLNKDERALMIEEAGEGAEWALEGELEKLVLEKPQQGTSQDLASATARARGIFQQKNIRVLPKYPAKADAQSPFVFVEKMFGPRALLAVKELSLSGQDIQRFIYVLLWKLKQKRMYSAYFEGIKAESQMRRDPKNSEEILERFISSIKT
ncbi:hypothetical protein A2W54_01005 [Candidatus Giovannonibacteria bacterium RIFCSPHIGHO2_02_43_13]|uniref:Uncharacterized protein n=1 Tax=Candidatus Giovannonibacteria bacterium RIFCSPHIGHO2_02_43_13 TaxID=1798330 RepID=A0A1F5WTZ7_9BACT|nr:MAG: hypothetical protein A3E06_01215 [Candidatus Giovannonibacteria bacterium RIFCSPHIGHO2_12_FULL_44_42]OGF79112.1 MAG: hypothetical protein A2W54_01005 [Candidatus Giovannonibacteria bacterium RIFCSPHIGHO2_02_43_13]OGF90123.1 MAG: hypothetical protein A3I94_01905 [Candidatus Giovannonibacteria bacterium RIFCSPLOWO2_02_FULL_43_54]OGF97297.1 MAG: hypothetical protein A3H08_00730 [Candidatus Giovannonibacteria bacterium RIFCSPLOWO2_12_FULL_44_32]